MHKVHLLRLMLVSLRWLNNVSCLFVIPANHKQQQTRINREKNTFCVIKSSEQLKNLKIGRVRYLDLQLTMQILKSHVHLARWSL
jgi:hypothetical protein